MTDLYSSTKLADNTSGKACAGPLPASGTVLRIDERLCLNLRGRTLSCLACKDRCTSGALELSEHTVTLNTDNCTACGACLPSCPSGVFRLRDFSPADLLRGLKGQREAHIHCTATSDEDAGIELSCLHLLDARLLAAALAAGTEVFHLTGLEHCLACRKGNAINHMIATQNRLLQWFGATSTPHILVAGMPLTMWLSDHHRAEEPARMSRRQFFRHAGIHAMASAKHFSAPAQEGNDLSLDTEAFHTVNTRYQRAVDYQSLLAARASELPWHENEIPWHARTIDNDACNACLVCGQLCPTGALQAEQAGAGRGISFQTGLCTDCNLCSQLCPMHAIDRRQVSDTAEVTGERVMLISRHSRRCRHCKQEFLPQAEDETLCHACKNEQALENEWLAHCAH